ncbi:hypothetical protein LCGC14_2866380 [marine sediment metagenome]|uniref:Uncharacterized protein n=1 Tax=marine sediment metagenome TaxID=412755 RepID=A0A0F8Y4E9_9ZZZZ
MEITIGDSLRAHHTIKYALSDKQGIIIEAMWMGSDLIQVYDPEHQKVLWDMTGRNGTIPHKASVKVLVKRNIIIPTISDKEWKIQIALGSMDERIWKLNPAILEPLENAVCLLRTTEENLKAGRIFNADTKTDDRN